MFSKEFLEQLVQENRAMSDLPNDYHAGRADLAQDLLNMFPSEDKKEIVRFICQVSFVVPKVNFDGELSGDALTVEPYSLWQLDSSKSIHKDRIRLTQVDGFCYIEITKDILEENFTRA